MFSSTLIHYGQEVASGKFQSFDFGKLKNLKKYGSLNPPEYKLNIVKVPVAAYWSQNDLLCENSVKIDTTGLNYV